MVTKLISKLFPPTLRSLGRISITEQSDADEQGSCSKAQPMTGIEKERRKR